MNSKVVDKIGWFAAILAVVMFSSYLDQIRLNMQGQKGSVILPIATIVNCATWSVYAFLKEKRDYPLLVCNLLGVLFALLTVITAVI